MKAQIKLKQSGGADMYEKEMIIKNKTGLHARPATDLSTLCQTYESDIKIRTNDTEIDSKSIISILSGGICKGTKIKLVINGTDEKEAGEKISEFIENLKEQIALELKSRPAYILKIILEQKNGYTVDRIIEKLNITKRTFY